MLDRTRAMDARAPRGAMHDLERPTSPRSLLDFAWEGNAFTATDAMRVTGLTRTTVIAQSDELVRQGWLERLEDARTAGEGYRAGRPALRFALRAHAGRLIGIDAGEHTLRAIVTDLRGNEIERAEHHLGPCANDADLRRRSIVEFQDRLRRHGSTQYGPVLSTVVGLPAPVDARGHTTQGLNPFWDRMNPGLIECLAGPVIGVENDANLAALAEHRLGAARGTSLSVTLLGGDRFGAGIVAEGHLLRGVRGAAGEMHGLRHVSGVENSHGIAAVARDLLRDARNSGSVPVDSPLSGLSDEEVASEAVFLAAADEDPFGMDIIGQIARRLARIIAVIASVLDMERVVIAGAMAPHLDVMLPITREILATMGPTIPPEIVASPLGGDVVAWGAVSQASILLREAARRAEPILQGGTQAG